MNQSDLYRDPYVMMAQVHLEASTLAELRQHVIHDGGRRTFTVPMRPYHPITCYVLAGGPDELRALATRLTLLADEWQDEQS